MTGLRGTARIGLDVVVGIAGLVEAMLAEAGFAPVHVPGLAVKPRPFRAPPAASTGPTRATPG